MAAFFSLLSRLPMGNNSSHSRTAKCGKSTLFNRLTESRKAIVDEQSGVTRDRHYGFCEWNGRRFSVIDTGGYARGTDDVFEEEIRRQVELAMDEASLILMVTDVETGITDLDEEMAGLLRKSKKEVILVANKVDNNARIADASVFYKFGLGDPYSISSISGSGTGELLDAILDKLPEMLSMKQKVCPG
jgi:GTP-binding protein